MILALLRRPLEALASSIVLRLSLVAGFIVFACFSAFSLLVATATRDELEQQVSAQQRSAAVLLADIVDRDFADRFEALQEAAAELDPVGGELSSVPGGRLESHTVLTKLFNGGYFLTGLDGIALQSVPANLQRVGKNYSDRPFVQAALAGESVVGDPVVGKQMHTAIIVMAVPVRRANGPVVGALMGVIDLSQPSFLDRIAGSKYGKGGGFALVSPKTRLIVTATDRRLVMKEVPDQDPTVKRFLAGFEGTGVLTNSAGVTLLASAKRTPTTGWYVTAALPLEEAYATVNDLQRRLNVAGFALLVLALVAAGWAIRHAMAPLQQAVRGLALNRRRGDGLEPLPIAKPDEAGVLIAAFNEVLGDLNQKQVALRDSELRYRSLVHSLHVGVVVHGPDASITLSNARAQALLSLSEDQLAGKTSLHPDWNVVHEDGTPFPGETHPAMQAMASRRRVEGVVMGVYRPSHGDRIWLQVNADPRVNEAGALVEVVVTFIDITGHLQAQEALKRSEAFSQSVIDSLAENVAVLDRDANIVAVNQAWKDFSIANGADSEWGCGVGSNYLNVCRPILEGPEAQDAAKSAKGISAVMQGDRTYFEYEYPCHAPHQKRWFRMGVTPLRGTAGGVVVSHANVTERKLGEVALQRAGLEKDALLKEVHHRVKNNLQVVTSLLRMEARRSQVPEAVGPLQAMQNRIRAMSQLHESLYRSGTLASVDLGVYLGQIATQAFRTQLLSGARVQLKLNVESVHVGMDQANACGLLVNELVSNCLKHGFPDNRPGEVYLQLHPVDPATAVVDSLWRLQVSDTGVGLPPDFDTIREDSLGLQLVGDLSRQVGGTLTIAPTPEGGAEFSVVFKVLAPAPLVMP